MDQYGSIVDTNIRIYPSATFTKYLNTLPTSEAIPGNILKLINGKGYKVKETEDISKKAATFQLNNKDIEIINKIKEAVSVTDEEVADIEDALKEPEVKAPENKDESDSEKKTHNKKKDLEEDEESSEESKTKEVVKETRNDPYITTSDLDWLFTYLEKNRGKGGKEIPFLHELLEGSEIEMPENKVLKRNPVLEERCVILRAQQEAREYRAMTRCVDNVRMRFPEDSISYQLKQVNRQLIAIGQFIISIFAGFLFGFKGLEWMIGSLEFGFRLLLGVMCALIIALAEIYFLAKKLNEELSIPETTQLGGPPKFANQPNDYTLKSPKSAIDKEHKD